MLRLPVFAIILVALSYGSAVRLPWIDQRLQNTAGLQEAPTVDISVRNYTSNVTCARLSAAISVLVQYQTDGIQDGVVQVIVPDVNSISAVGSCGPDAYIQLSWTADAAPVASASSLTLLVEEELEPELLLAAENSNNLRFNFENLNETFALSSITGIINIAEVPQDYSANTTLEVFISHDYLIEAPRGVVYICYEKSIFSQEGEENITAVAVMLTDFQMLAYYEGNRWPAQATYCRSSVGSSDPDNTMAIVLGTCAGVVGVALLGAFIYYLRTR